jgi:hypothetical protein
MGSLLCYGKFVMLWEVCYVMGSLCYVTGSLLCYGKFVLLCYGKFAYNSCYCCEIISERYLQTVKPEAATAVVELLMMGVRTPETC